MASTEAQVLPDSLVVMEGQVVSNDSLLPIPNAHIISKDNHWGTISNDEGLYRMLVSPGDSVLFTSIGFSPIIVYVDDTVLASAEQTYVLMEKDTILINEVVIRAYWDYETFKRLITNMEPLDISQFYPDWEGTELLYRPITPTPIGGPIQGLYNLFNQDARLQRKLVKNRKQYNKMMIQMGRPQDTIPVRPEHRR
jgi:hypothetical protein